MPTWNRISTLDTIVDMAVMGCWRMVIYGDGCACITCIILVGVKGRVRAEGDFIPFLGQKISVICKIGGMKVRANVSFVTTRTHSCA